jgi:hypothetical protein
MSNDACHHPQVVIKTPNAAGYYRTLVIGGRASYFRIIEDDRITEGY